MNFPEDIRAQLYKIASISLCPNTIGQVATSLMVRGPEPSEASYAQFEAERKAIYDALRRKAELVSRKLNEIEGVSSQNVDGALYAFPTIQLPTHVIEAAAEKGITPDAYFCMELLEATGIVTVPGSGFRQVEGTFVTRRNSGPPIHHNLDANLNVENCKLAKKRPGEFQTIRGEFSYFPD